MIWWNLKINGLIELIGCKLCGKVGLSESVCCLIEKLQKTVFIPIPGEGQYLVLIIAKRHETIFQPVTWQIHEIDPYMSWKK